MKKLLPLSMLIPTLWAHAQLEGVIDLHVHSAPDSIARSIDALEVARLARRHGMRALLLKNHFSQTASLAYLVSQVVPDIEVYGGIVLNRSVGGINPVAVQHMVDTTSGLGRVVWMPTFDSEYGQHVLGENPNHVPVSRDGALLPEVREILELMAQYDLALATGHSSPEESMLLIREARVHGVDRIIVTHPSSSFIGMTTETQREAARLGALLEYPVVLALEADEEGLEAFLTRIREVGPQHVVLSTDLGQAGNPVHTDGFALIIARLLQSGFRQTEIDLMTKRNPARVLGLP